MRYLLPAILKTTRPSLRILALRISRFTSAGFVQSACLTCRNQAITGSLASATPSPRLRKALIVLSAITLTTPVLIIVPHWDQAPCALLVARTHGPNLFIIDLNSL